MDQDKLILGKFNKNFDILINSIDKQDINFYVKFLMETLFSSNKYFNDEAPWNKKEVESDTFGSKEKINLKHK